MKPLLIFLLSSFCIHHSSFSAQPNILLILADDLGYADIGVNGSRKDIATPHIDSIAKNGVRFTDGYATHPVYSPSRAEDSSSLAWIGASIPGVGAKGWRLDDRQAVSRVLSGRLSSALSLTPD